MRKYDRLLAGVIWLEKFTVFSPMNFSEDNDIDRDIIQWGNYAVGNNLYPNLFNIFVKYSPTADTLLNKVVRLIFGNMPKDLRKQRTTLESSFTNTLYSLVKNAGRDYLLYKGSFAIWVGYDETGKINEFKWIPIEFIRYLKRDSALYSGTDNEYMIAVLSRDEYTEVESVYYPYEPSRAIEQRNALADVSEDEKEEMPLKPGQVLFYNTADDQIYPDCVFNSLLPVLLSDAGVDTAMMSFLGNSDILKTYKKRPGNTGADSANGGAGIFDGMTIEGIWGAEQAQDLTTPAHYGSDYFSTGVKSAGSTEYMNIPGESEAIDNYVKPPEFPTFMDEISKLDERTARRICVALDIPYEYVYKMESGLLNQDNRKILFDEINMLLEDPRDTFETVIGDILAHSIYPWTFSIPPIGAGKDDVADANANVNASEGEA